MNEQQQTEWVAWRSFCSHFEDATGRDINDPEMQKVVHALHRWGEELVLLRDSYPLPENHLAEIRRLAPIHRRIEAA
jgi:hypothetical protein